MFYRCIREGKYEEVTTQVSAPVVGCKESFKRSGSSVNVTSLFILPTNTDSVQSLFSCTRRKREGAAEGDKVPFVLSSTLTISRIRRGSLTQFCLHMGPLIPLFTSSGTVYGSLSLQGLNLHQFPSVMKAEGGGGSERAASASLFISEAADSDPAAKSSGILRKPKLTWVLTLMERDNNTWDEVLKNTRQSELSRCQQHHKTVVILLLMAGALVHRHRGKTRISLSVFWQTKVSPTYNCL